MKLLKDFFSGENIEYYGVLPYSSCRESAPSIMEREGFTPNSVIVFLIPYYTGAGENLSAYSVSKDYHIYIKYVTEKLIERLKLEYPEARFHGYGDHSPIDERLAAAGLGLGIFGDNGLLINEKYGSYVFIADVVSTLTAEELSGEIKSFEIKSCVHCGACQRACPTGVLCGTSSKCLSEITQRKGELSQDEADLMRRYNTAWGCDECQKYCPYNLAAAKTPIKFFYEDRIEKLTPELLSEMPESEFRTRAFAWRKRKTVERNLNILFEIDG